MGERESGGTGKPQRWLEMKNMDNVRCGEGHVW